MNKKLYKLTLDTQKSIGALSELAYETGVQDGLIKANALNALKPLDNTSMRWIPCTERLPNVGAILISDGNQVFIGAYYGNSIWSADGCDYDPILEDIAWMPLPEPYKENNDQ